MTIPYGTSASRPEDDPKGSGDSRAGVLAVVLVVAALALAGAWRFLFGARAPEAPATSEATGPRPEGGKPYVPASHVDVARAKLSAGPDGNARVDLVLRDVGDTAALAAKLRKGPDPKSPTLFLDSKTGTNAVGLLGIRFAETGSPGETAITVELGVPATHVTVIDLRFGGRWEGLELDASASTWK